MRIKYQDEHLGYEHLGYVHVGDIVMLREGEVQIVGEVIFHERSATLDFNNEKGAGLHVRVLFEMVETQEKCGMIEGSGRFIKHVSPDRLTLLSRRCDEVRYLSGEVIKSGDIVVDPYLGDLETAASIVEKVGLARYDFYLSGNAVEKIYMEMTSAVRKPGIQYGLAIDEYWDDDGCGVNDSMQHYFFVSRAEDINSYSSNI